MCCVAPAFARSADFANDKPAGQPCRWLDGDARCSIHDHLRASGMVGCAVFDCFGAGQRATDAWRGDPRLHQAFFALRALHELMFLVVEALALPEAAAVHPALRAALHETDRIAGDPDRLLGVDLARLRGEINAHLVAASELARAASPGPRLDRRGADLVGKDLRRVDLRGASLRGAWLLGADLRGVDLSAADLTGADLRGADLRAADLSRSLFVSQPQLEAALGDRTTRVPPRRERPTHWTNAVLPRQA